MTLAKGLGLGILAALVIGSALAAHQLTLRREPTYAGFVYWDCPEPALVDRAFAADFRGDTYSSDFLEKFKGFERAGCHEGGATVHEIVYDHTVSANAHTLQVWRGYRVEEDGTGFRLVYFLKPFYTYPN